MSPGGENEYRHYRSSGKTRVGVVVGIGNSIELNHAAVREIGTRIWDRVKNLFGKQQ